jgi:hypothetical protein
MDNISSMSKQQLDEVKIILTDINDTLTTNGRLKSDVFIALEKLSNSSYIVIPVTGRCAGWCDHIARMWPVNGVVELTDCLLKDNLITKFNCQIYV